MYPYILRRLLLIVPTLFGIMVINFIVIQFVPGGPVEQMIAQLTGDDVAATARFGGGATQETGDTSQRPDIGSESTSRYRGAQGLPPDLILEIEQQFGLDKPAHERLMIMMGNYIRFDFGDSYFQDRSVAQLLVDKLPVSISLGLWTTLLVYLISIPLGVAKAVRDGSRFDVWTSGLVIFGNAVPGFLFAILLIILFAGGRYLDWFPLRGLFSTGWEDLHWFEQIKDYFWHLTLPLLSMVIGGFAGLTMLTKNSFLEEINKQYVITARAKGLTERRMLYGHVFRNAMLIVIAGFPSAFIGIFFTGSLLTEVIFSLDGIGLLGFEAALTRDYPVMFGTLFLFTLLGLVMGIISDVMYHLVDPRIDFETRET
ncbi:MAG TPA: microcin ABC transporter permease [Gammaproteobacteria bacterium]|nr:microcin ABC transporter permease [Gammaproteobacteria bacterium]|tara:strand:+ start:69 stop:1178 length:1110 start_codon:yes stop_codon:yes gene_type:complete